MALSKSEIDKSVRCYKNNRYYRFGDIVFGRIGRLVQARSVILNDPIYENTVLREYLQLIDINQRRPPRFAQLIRVIDKYKSVLDDKLRIHVRCGDIITSDRFHGGCFIHNINKLVLDVHRYIRRENNINELVLIVAMNYEGVREMIYTHEKHRKNIMALRQIVTRLSKRFHLPVSIFESDSTDIQFVDESFVQLVHSKHVLLDGGGFSRLVSRVREILQRGATRDQMTHNVTGFTHQLTGRGLLSELNSVLGLYEEQLLGDKQTIHIHSKGSRYFQYISFFDVFEVNDILVDHVNPNSELIDTRYPRRFATAGWQRKISTTEASKAFVYKKHIYDRISRTIEQLNLPDQFACFHIRRGDKVLEKPDPRVERSGRGAESKRYEFAEYLNHASEINTIFIMTDDYKCVLEAKKYIHDNNLNHQLIYLTEQTQDGNSEWQDMKSNRKYEIDELLQFLVEIEIAKMSTKFIGTCSSNVYRFIRDTCSTGTEFISLD